MSEEEIRKRIEAGRNFVRSFNDELEDFVSDQDLKKPHEQGSSIPPREL